MTRTAVLIAPVTERTEDLPRGGTRWQAARRISPPSSSGEPSGNDRRVARRVPLLPTLLSPLVRPSSRRHAVSVFFFFSILNCARVAEHFARGFTPDVAIVSLSTYTYLVPGYIFLSLLIPGVNSTRFYPLERSSGHRCRPFSPPVRAFILCRA